MYHVSRLALLTFLLTGLPLLQAQPRLAKSPAEMQRARRAQLNRQGRPLGAGSLARKPREPNKGTVSPVKSIKPTKPNEGTVSLVKSINDKNNRFATTDITPGRQTQTGSNALEGPEAGSEIGGDLTGIQKKTDTNFTKKAETKDAEERGEHHNSDAGCDGLKDEMRRRKCREERVSRPVPASTVR